MLMFFLFTELIKMCQMERSKMPQNFLVIFCVIALILMYCGNKTEKEDTSPKFSGITEFCLFSFIYLVLILNVKLV